MAKPSIKCSRCGEEFEHGLDYRWHFDVHIDEFAAAEDKNKYIKETTVDYIRKIQTKPNTKANLIRRSFRRFLLWGRRFKR
jgi:hypothetical protein